MAAGAFAVDDPTVLEAATGSFRCLGPGYFNVSFQTTLTNFAADNPFLVNNLHLPPLTGVLSYVMTGSCSTGVNVTPPPPNRSPTSSP
jgi:hypothetical protein